MFLIAVSLLQRVAPNPLCVKGYGMVASNPSPNGLGAKPQRVPGHPVDFGQDENARAILNVLDRQPNMSVSAGNHYTSNREAGLVQVWRCVGRLQDNIPGRKAL